MKRVLPLLVVLASLAVLPQVGHAAAPRSNASTVKTPKFPVNFRGHLTGKIVYFKYFAGMEPDFDILSRVVLEGTIRSPSAPPMTLVLDSYIENFQTETQPVLPDLIHPNVSLSYQLGGFFSGESLILAPNNKTLYTGSLYIEALISPSCLVNSPACKKSGSEPNHMLLYELAGQGAARGGILMLRSYFLLNKKGQISGSVYGQAKIPQAARTLLRSGSGHLPGKKVLKLVHLAKPAQIGKGGTGKPGRGFCLPGGHHCTSNGQTGTPPPGYKPPKTSPGSGNTTATTSSRPGWMAPLGGALIGLAVILLLVFFWQQRTQGGQPPGNPTAGDSSAPRR